MTASPTASDLLRAYFESGAVICPFARSAALSFFDARGLATTAGSWLDVLRAGGVAVVTAGDDLLDFDTAGQWCRDTLARLQALAGADDSPWPFFHTGADTFYVIGMGPQYPEMHPRYAPALCLSAVNEAEVRRVPERLRAPIRSAMLERTGVLYDADHVWLPLAPRARAAKEIA